MQSNDFVRPVIELKDIDMTFTGDHGLFKPHSEIQALTKVNLSIYPGEVVALVGESGGGKTTVGNVISGIIKPTGGHMFFDGVDVLKMTGKQFAEYRRQVQIVQQDAYAALNPAHTVYHALSSPLLRRKLVRGHKEAHTMVKELLETVELRPIEQFVNKYPPPALRRPAPEDIARARDFIKAQAHHRRRAGLHDRRVPARLGAQPHEQAQPRDWDLVSLHHP